MAEVYGRGQERVQPPIPKAGIGGSPRFAEHVCSGGIHERVGGSHDGMKIGVRHGGGLRPWARTGTATNSKGRNWRQSPFCGARMQWRNSRESWGLTRRDENRCTAWRRFTAVGKNGYSHQFQRQELEAVPVLRSTYAVEEFTRELGAHTTG